MRFLLLLFVAYSSSALARVDRFIGKESVSPRVSHLGHRHYSNVLCRFLSLDDAKAMNSSYAYTYGNPIAQFDPTGLYPMMEVEDEVAAGSSHVDASSSGSPTVSSSTEDATHVAGDDSESQDASHINPAADKEVKNIVLYQAKIEGTPDFVTITYNVPPKYIAGSDALKFNDIGISDITALGVQKEIKSLFDLFGSADKDFTIRHMHPDVEPNYDSPGEEIDATTPIPTAMDTHHRIKQKMYSGKSLTGEEVDYETRRTKRMTQGDTRSDREIEEQYRGGQRMAIEKEHKRILQMKKEQSKTYGSILSTYDHLLND